jgi:hypothetical protein
MASSSKTLVRQNAVADSVAEQGSSAEEVSCLAMIERIKKDHMQELEEQEDLFKEALQETSEFKKAADTLEWYIARLKATYKRALEAVETYGAAWPNLTRMYKPDPDGGYTLLVWMQDDIELSEDQVRTMEADRASFYREHGLHPMHPLERQANRLRLLLNKEVKNNVLPFRVINHMKLTFENDIGDFRTLSVTTSACVKQAINGLKCVEGACDVLRDTLWDRDLTLPIVHPNKRRRVFSE